MKFIYYIIFFLLYTHLGISQHQCNIWYTGFSLYGTTEWNFTPNSLSLSLYNYPISFFQCNASISEKNGNLAFYTNGLIVMSAAQDTMLNGTGLNPGPLATWYPEYGYPMPQGAIIIPNPSNNGIYYLFHTPGVEHPAGLGFYTDKLLYSVIDMNLENGLGAVTQKNIVAIQGFQQGYMAAGQLVATKHANGRDWWVVIPRVTMNGFYKVLVSTNGIESSILQNIGTYTPTYSNGQATFSADGSHYVRFYPGDHATDSLAPLFIYDFDRCTGLLSNERILQLPLEGGASIGGCAVSANSRYLYVSTYKRLYQFDLQASDIAASQIEIGVYDGFIENFAVSFNAMQLAIDGKIYMNAPNGVTYFHVINSPDSQGLACNFQQRGLQLPSKNSASLPNFPNYALGALSGSACDTITTTTSKPLEIANLYAYPNPTKDKLYIGMNHIPQGAEILIINSLGQQVYRKQVADTTQETEISSVAFPQGVYYLQVRAENAIFTEKIIKE